MSKISRRIRRQLLNLIPVTTHALAAILPTLALLPNPSPAMLAAATLMGNLPDVDTTYSHVGRLLYPIARILEAHTGHRNATHSLAAVGAVAAVAYGAAWFGYEPWAWWWWPAWYASHLVLDMVVGGKSGVPLLWPAPVRFYLATIEGGSAGEKAILALMLIALGVIIQRPNIQPARILHQKAATLDFAIQDYRAWEPWYHVLADVEATDQATHAPVVGVFEIISARGDTLTLRNLTTGEIVTAGQRDEQLYIRRIVARRGPPRAAVVGPPPSPTPSVTPEYMKVIVDHVTNPMAQIRVAAGDYVTPGSILADYGPQPTPSPTLTPTPSPTPNLLPRALALNAIHQAEIAATATAQAAHPRPEAIQAARARLALARRSLQQAQAAYDRVAWRPDIAARPEALALERATNTYRLAVAQATAAAQTDEISPKMALAALTQAEIAATATAIAARPRPTPPRPATPTPTPRPRYVRALASGLVTGWRISRAYGPEAVVEIYIMLATPTPPVPDERNALAAENSSPRPTRAQYTLSQEKNARLQPATVISVIDGDTIDVQVRSRRERIRLIGVDTPEVTKGKRDCYGPEAYSFTMHFVQASPTVYIETDQQERDHYGRLLAYVWDQTKTRMLNYELARLGYARVKLYPPNMAYSTELTAAGQAARAGRVGLWGACHR